MAKRKTSDTTATEPQATTTVQQYTVLARRYRPQQFSDLIGQEAVGQALSNALESNRVAHAYLFTGPRGVGKTSTARILAKALNCAEGPTATPCGTCDQCRSIAAGEDVDVLEIDGASNRGIDEVREIRQNVQFRPSRARFKIYIIDEVHMLTAAAFNALLKTLEEPPPHVKFMFATTEVQKIPVTILSRCQRFDFSGIRPGMIVDRLRGIVEGEQREADHEALELVARRAGGSMRDAQSLLDQLLAFASEKLTVEEVHRLLGTANAERIADLATAICKHESQEALRVVEQTVEDGQQPGELLDQLIDYWRDLMVVSSTANEELAISVSGSHRQTLKDHAQQLQTDTILAGLDVLVSAKNRMRSSQYGRVLLEMAVVRLSRLENLVSLSQLADMFSGDSQPPAPTTATSKAAPARRPSPPAATEKKKLGVDPVSDATVEPIPLTSESLERVWHAVLSNVGPFLSAALQKAGNVAIFGPNTLAIHISTGYNSDSESYLQAQMPAIEQSISKVTGQNWAVRIETSRDDSNAQVEAKPMVRPQQSRGELGDHPLVGRAMKLLGAQIVHMDDGFQTESSDEPEEA